MDVRSALKGQYGAGLKMLRQGIVRCPDEMWLEGTHPRTTWRICFHAVFFTHLYLMPSSKDFVKFRKTLRDCAVLWGSPKVREPYSKQEVLDYLDMVLGSMPGWVDALDLSGSESGFSYYPNMSKMEHQLVNIRHLQGHVGQLSELLMMRGIETDWMSSG